MSKKRILLLLLAFLSGLGLAKMVAAQSLINGPDQAKPGTLVTFEIQPPQITDWTITSVETTEKVFQTDTSTNRLYFATPQPGTYHIVAAIVVDEKPRLLTKTLINGNDDDIKPQPSPEPPKPPLPPTPLGEWIQTQCPVLVKSPNIAAEQLLVAQCFEQTVQKIENDTIKTAQNARAQLQIALTTTLAFASDTAIDDWHDFLTQLSTQMADELGDKVNNLDSVKAVFQTVAKVMKSLEWGVWSVELKEERHEPEIKQSKTFETCEKCSKTPHSPTPNSTLQTPGFQLNTPSFRPLRLFR